jgi:hypothetical protein
LSHWGIINDYRQLSAGADRLHLANVASAQKLIKRDKEIVKIEIMANRFTLSAESAEASLSTGKTRANREIADAEAKAPADRERTEQTILDVRS